MWVSPRFHWPNGFNMPLCIIHNYRTKVPLFCWLSLVANPSNKSFSKIYIFYIDHWLVLTINCRYLPNQYWQLSRRSIARFCHVQTSLTTDSHLWSLLITIDNQYWPHNFIIISPTCSPLFTVGDHGHHPLWTLISTKGSPMIKHV